ncbi:MAG: efflux RND transporter periplasmic adaptor subunit [Burkholderiaceae bacterium]
MSQSPTRSTSNAINDLLGEDRPSPWWKRPTLWLAVAAVLLAGGAWRYWQSQQQDRNAPVYVTEALGKGDITLTVAANGTLQPTRSVEIGSELSGTVKRVLVDVNDQVKAGQVLVELDTSKLGDQVTQARAGLASAQAQQVQAAATVSEAKSTLARYEEVARLSGGKVPSATELDSARAAVDRAQASEAAARAAVDQARAALATNETNLSKASIRSPINGVVLSRSVDPGNAVAASLQAVTLFTVAEDLTQLKLDVAVDEADVGNVKVGQRATFTVSAFPARRYPAAINRVAFGSTTTDNVVTYTTTLDVDNQDLSLRPGMTAAATIVAREARGVLRVPNTALRFTPSSGNGAAASGGGILSKIMPRPPRSNTAKTAGTDRSGGNARSIWVLQNGQPVQLSVTTGISDGRYTEVSGEALAEGVAVITEQRSTSSGS